VLAVAVELVLMAQIAELTNTAHLALAAQGSNIILLEPMSLMLVVVVAADTQATVTLAVTRFLITVAAVQVVAEPADFGQQAQVQQQILVAVVAVAALPVFGNLVVRAVLGF
jgi:hypothetical protein